jgi:hypothetical protein
MGLSTKERNYIELAFMRGPVALLEQGWNYDQIQQFFDRQDVKTEMEQLAVELKYKEAYAARLRFGLKRQIARFGSGAVSILSAALAGPIYARDKNGNIVTDAKGHAVVREYGPTDMQVSAAKDILDRVGVSAEGRDAKRFDSGVTDGVSINLTLKSDAATRLEIEDDPEKTTPEELAMSRERMRTTIEILAKKIPAVRKRVLKEIEAPKKNKGVKKKVKK